MLEQQLKGKRALVLGVANQRSIAWGISKVLGELGVRQGFTFQGERIQSMVEPLAEQVGGDFLVPCDVSRDEDIEALFAKVDEAWGGLDYLIHSVAFADREDLAGAYADTSRDGFAKALDIKLARMTKLIKAFEKRGLVSRHNPVRDRRVVELSLTPAGCRLVEDMTPRLLQADGSNTRNFKPKDRAEFNRLLKRYSGFGREAG